MIVNGQQRSVHIEVILGVILGPLFSYFRQVSVSYVLFKPGNIYIFKSCFKFVFLRHIRLQPRDDIDEQWMKSMTNQ